MQWFSRVYITCSPTTISLPLLSYHHHLISLPATLPHVHFTVTKLASLVILERPNRAPASEPLLLLFLLPRSFFHKSEWLTHSASDLASTVSFSARPSTASLSKLKKYHIHTHIKIFLISIPALFSAYF